MFARDIFGDILRQSSNRKNKYPANITHVSHVPRLTNKT